MSAPQPAVDAPDPFHQPSASPVLTRDSLRRAALIVGALLVVAVPVGVLWWALTPDMRLVVVSGVAYPAEPDGSSAVAADRIFCALTLAAGLLTGLAAGLRPRWRDPVTVVALVAGGALAAILAWRLGVQLGPASVTNRARDAADNTHLTGPLRVRATAVLLAWPIAALVTFLALVLGLDRGRE